MADQASSGMMEKRDISMPTVQVDTTLNKEILSFEEAKKQIAHLLRNEYYSGDGKWNKIANSKPPVNEIGAESLCLRVFPFLNTNTVMNYLSADGIIMITKNIQDMIWNDLINNQDEWTVDKKQWDSVVVMISDICYLTLNRAYRNLEREYHKGTHMEETRQIQSMGSRQGGFFSKVWRR